MLTLQWPVDFWVSRYCTVDVVLVFTVAKDVLLYGVKLTQETYAVLIAACAYIAHGYRRFASGVDRLTDKYNKVRQRFK
ncbi:hypothetical protein TELCIR_18056 [Teladorsagia circumcincta]|uniref:Uncharacterized protein n=1 Tax=Teladorsagia circumcincta TaxID=45464 RepID=A0A2G9TR23_TELCI|nr:hypothetical protein TELCIR_18056 [Teladorsagia circumcincta]